MLCAQLALEHKIQQHGNTRRKEKQYLSPISEASEPRYILEHKMILSLSITGQKRLKRHAVPLIHA